MRILVTGAAGFIGSNLTGELLSRGHAVVGLDNLSQGSRLNLSAVETHPSFEFREADIRDESAMREAADGCEVLVHLAAYKIPRYGDAYETLIINGLGSEIVAQTAARTGAKAISELPMVLDSSRRAGRSKLSTSRTAIGYLSLFRYKRGWQSRAGAGAA